MSRASSRRVAIEVHQSAHRRRRDRHAAGALADDRRHRREQHGRACDRKSRIGQAEAVDPRDLVEKPDHLAECEQDADHQHADDQRVEARIGHERHDDLLVQHDDDQAAQDQKHHHPDEEDPGRGQFEGVEVSRHVGSALKPMLGRQYGTAAARSDRRESSANPAASACSSLSTPRATASAADDASSRCRR